MLELSWDCYLFTFAVNQLSNFVLNECNSVMKLHGIDWRRVYKAPDNNLDVSHMIMRLPSREIAIKIVKRCVMVKELHELWGYGLTYDQVISSIKENAYISKERMEPFLQENVTYSARICCYGISLDTKIQQERRVQFNFIPFQGKVQLKNPDQTYWITENWGTEWLAHQTPEERQLTKPYGLYFSRFICEGARHLITDYTLKKREYLGPTSMCEELSFLMANEGLCRKGALVLDTFAGSGSILIATTYFGSVSIGTDIDIRILKGQRKGQLIGKSPFSNFAQYKLPMPEMIRADTSTSPTRPIPIYDAIVCDPPYGIRAGGRKAGSKNEVVKTVPLEKIPDHVPMTQPYDVADMMVDLLDNAAKWLVIGGRLVYLLPSGPILTEEEIPSHPLLKIVARSEEKLSLKVSRHLITMEKVSEYVLSKSKEYRDEARKTISVFSLEEADLAFNQMRTDNPGLYESNRAKKARLRSEYRKKIRMESKGLKGGEKGEEEEEEDDEVKEGEM